MNQSKLPIPDFMFNKSLSLKAIDGPWVRARAAELVTPDNPVPDNQAALLEAVEVLQVRLGHNLVDDTPVMVFEPSNDEDPYIVGISIHQFTPRGNRKAKPASKLVTPTEPPRIQDTKQNTLREDFENMLFEMGGHPPSIVDRDDRDVYILPWVQEQWNGFKMYHYRFTSAGTDTHKGKYDRTLGRYVIGKINFNGSATFHAMPYRHQTKALAKEEANRLSMEHNCPFGVFRCLDIVDNR